MASKTWFAVSLMLLIWFGYLRWFAPPTLQQADQVKASQSSTSSGVQAPSQGNTNLEVVNSSGQLSSFAPIKAGGEVPVKTKAMDIQFSANGGKIMSVKLPKFHETIDDRSPLIAPVSPEKTTLALGALFTDPSLADFSGGTYDVKHQGDAVSFSKQNKTATVTKDYRVSPDSNFIDGEFKISFPKGDKKEWGSLLIPVGTKDNEEFHAQTPLKSWEVVFYQNDEIHRVSLEKLKKEEETVKQGRTEWLAFGNRYFSSAVINQGNDINPDVVFKKTENFNGAYLRYPIVLKNGQKDLRFSLRFYVGPKDDKELSKVPGLKKLIDYGTFTVFAYPLLEILRFFHRFINNYGIAIILLTLFVRALFYPLSQKSMKSMKEMQKLQPKIAALKEKYKDDQKKLNEEQMALFKAHKVNPAGGCLPMLVQLPVFIALYAVLGNSIELFHAPFFGWIQDLSTKDPFYVYPVLMGLAMVLQQKMTPSSGVDPAQQKMMMFMPVIFTFMMINLPSGLTLYIFVSTLLGVAQQMALRDKKGTVPQPA
jgi:YidC/Oxa1 family membrane protein insertase